MCKISVENYKLVILTTLVTLVLGTSSIEQQVFVQSFL